MDQQRRDTLKAGGSFGLFGLLVAAGLIRPELAEAAWNKGAFEARSLDAAFAALGAGKPADSADILITAPDIAENGAVVPIGVTSKLPRTEQIAILVEKNPYMLAANFEIPAGTAADIQTRIKMGQTADVYALVKADGKFLVARKEVKVTLGGCGG